MTNPTFNSTPTDNTAPALTTLDATATVAQDTIKTMSKEQLIRTLDAFVELYSRGVAEMPELQEDIDDFKDMSEQLKATL